jgi:hypothetical protein
MKKGSCFVACLFLFAFGFIASFLYNKTNLKKLTDKLIQLEIVNQNISQKLLQMNTLNSSLNKQSRFIESKNLIDDFKLKKLIKKGLKDPINDLRNDLIKHPELIPYKGVLGGTVGFGEDPESIIILNEKWILAVFSDGHFEGVMLLEFDILNNKIKWKVIDSFTR